MRTRPRSAPPPRPGDDRLGVEPDRAPHTHGRRAAPGRRRPRHRRLSVAGAHVARPRAVRRPFRDGRRCARPRLTARGSSARRRGAPPLQRRPPWPDRRAAASGDGARSDRGATGRDARDCGDPRSHAPQVRRPRRRGRLGRLDELDGRLVVASGERHRHRRVGRDRVRLLACVRAAVGSRQRRRDGRRRPPARGRRRRARARVVHARARRGALTSNRETSGKARMHICN